MHVSSASALVLGAASIYLYLRVQELQKRLRATTESGGSDNSQSTSSSSEQAPRHDTAAASSSSFGRRASASTVVPRELSVPTVSPLPPTSSGSILSPVPPAAKCCVRIGRDLDPAGKWPLGDVGAYLIDLDGTIYSPSGPIPGAAEFYASVLRHKPHVFLSNTGAKGANGVRSKLARNGIIMGPKNERKHIHTAAQAQCLHMIDVVPRGARVFVIAGGDADGPGSYWMKLLMAQSRSLVASWSLRTHLTDDMAREWAAAAAGGQPVFVVLFSDGSISSVADPSTGERGFADWSYDVIKKTSFVLAHGAKLIATAEDAFNPSTDNMPLPGPGMLVAMFRKLLHPFDREQILICGKGGNAGSKYMMEHALGMLREQGYTGGLEGILIVGDRFDTDITAGSLAGIRTCLVESGCHAISLQPHFAYAAADYVASSIADLIPPNRRGADSKPWREISFDVCGVTRASPGGRPAVAASPRVAAPPQKTAAHGLVASSSIDGGGAPTPPALEKQSSDGTASGLRQWQLGHGNLIYSAGSGAVQGPLILMLRAFFEQNARRTAGHGGSSPRDSNGSAEGDSRRLDDGDTDDALPTISAADALEAMRALGVSPPTLPDGRPLHHFPFDVTTGSRVTFSQLCRAVQRSREALDAAGGARHSASSEGSFRKRIFFDRSSTTRSQREKSVLAAAADASVGGASVGGASVGGTPRSRDGSASPRRQVHASPSAARLGSGGGHGGALGDIDASQEAPGMLQTQRTPRRTTSSAMSSSRRLPLCTSDTMLDTFEKRWLEAYPNGADEHGAHSSSSSSLAPPKLPSTMRHASTSRPSRQVQALVESSFLYLGREQLPRRASRSSYEEPSATKRST